MRAWLFESMGDPTCHKLRLPSPGPTAETGIQNLSFLRGRTWQFAFFKKRSDCFAATLLECAGIVSRPVGAQDSGCACLLTRSAFPFTLLISLIENMCAEVEQTCAAMLQQQVTC